MLKTKIICVPCLYLSIIENVLGSLDPNESAKVTFKTHPAYECGVYVIEFQTEQTFEAGDDIDEEALRELEQLLPFAKENIHTYLHSDGSQVDRSKYATIIPDHHVVTFSVRVRSQSTPQCETIKRLLEAKGPEVLAVSVMDAVTVVR